MKLERAIKLDLRNTSIPDAPFDVNGGAPVITATADTITVRQGNRELVLDAGADARAIEQAIGTVATIGLFHFARGLDELKAGLVRAARGPAESERWRTTFAQIRDTLSQLPSTWTAGRTVVSLENGGGAELYGPDSHLTTLSLAAAGDRGLSFTMTSSPDEPPTLAISLTERRGEVANLHAMQLHLSPGSTPIAFRVGDHRKLELLSVDAGELFTAFAERRREVSMPAAVARIVETLEQIMISFAR